MRSVCVFCGSNVGDKPIYQEVAAMLGQALAARGLKLVYGGGNVGLMGIVADAALQAGGEVVGVIPQALVNWEIAHDGAHGTDRRPVYARAEGAHGGCV